MQEKQRSSGETARQDDALTKELGKHATEASIAQRKEELDEEVDDILDEIDDVLESNAEEFVKSYIQKGGQ